MLNNLDIPLSNCSGQAYDNGSNMKGKNNGTQACIIQENPCARYIRSSAHTLNLTVSDSAKSSVTALHFFGVLQRLYTLFAASVKWRVVLIKHLNITLKHLCEKQ
jgi:hypothetical protein